MATLIPILIVSIILLILVIAICIIKRCWLGKDCKEKCCGEVKNLNSQCVPRIDFYQNTPYVRNEWVGVDLNEDDISYLNSVGLTPEPCSCEDLNESPFNDLYLLRASEQSHFYAEGGGGGSTTNPPPSGNPSGGTENPTPKPITPESKDELNFIFKLIDTYIKPEEVDIKPKTKDIAHGSNQVKIAVIDTGIHESFYSIPGFMKTGCKKADRNDVSGHGSVVSYLLYEELIRNYNFLEVIPDFTIFNYNATNENNELTLFNIMCSIAHAVRVNEVNVINLSLGVYNNIPVLRYFLAKLTKEKPNIIFVASAGNDAYNLNFVDHAPSMYHRNNDITALQVVGLASPSRVWGGTNRERGLKNIVDQAVHQINGHVVVGTSFAAPIITAKVAIAIVQSGPSYDAVQIRSIIENSNILDIS